MLRKCIALCLLFFLLVLTTSSFAQEDYWDGLMEQATRYLNEAELPRALKFATQAEYQARYDDADRHVSSLVLLARIQQDIGDLPGAEKSLRLAIELVDRIPGRVRHEKFVLHNNLGALLDLLGDIPAAEQQYRIAWSLHQGEQGIRLEDRFSLLVNFAGLLGRKGASDEAKLLYMEAESLSLRLPVTAKITVLNNLGTLLQQQANHAGAQDYFYRALDLFSSASSYPLVLASVHHNLGTSELEAGKLELAEKHLRFAETIRRDKLGIHNTDTAKTLSNLALLLERQGKYRDALSLARESSTIIVNLLATISGTSAIAASAQTRREWRESISTHLRLLYADDDKSFQKVSEALNIVQMVKQGELARVFSGMVLDPDSELGKRVQSIRQRSELLQAQENELSRELQSNSPDEGKERSIRKTLASNREQLSRLQLGLSTDFPQYHELVAGTSVSLGGIQSTLRDDEAAIAFFTSDAACFVIAITRNDAVLHKIQKNGAEIADAVRAIRKSVEPETADEAEFAFGPASELFNALIRPLARLVDEKSTWFVVADGKLDTIPLTLLLESDKLPNRRTSWREAAWVAKRHAVVTLPSLGALTLMRSNNYKQAVVPQALLAVADPKLKPPQQPESRAINSQRGRFFRPNNLWSTRSADNTVTDIGKPIMAELTPTVPGKRLADPNILRTLPSLPDTADEARLIAETLGGGILLMQEDATEANLKKMDLTKFRNLLFATHGAMASDLVDFGEPALVMTPPLRASDEDDGLLAASEIAQLRMNADWVLLSACNTASTDGTPGAEGLSGLAKAFFYAGARNLLVSHWSVVSESTVLLTSGVFKNLANYPTEGKARALQRSILELMDSNSAFQHPMYWAPFVLVGDGG